MKQSDIDSAPLEMRDGLANLIKFEEKLRQVTGSLSAPFLSARDTTRSMLMDEYRDALTQVDMVYSFARTPDSSDVVIGSFELYK